MGDGFMDRLRAAPSWLKWTAGVIVVVIVASAVGGTGGDDKKDTTTSTVKAATTTTARASTSTAAAKPKPKPKPAPRLSLADRIKQDVIDINLDGEGKVRVETQPQGSRREVLIRHELAENVTGGLTQRGAELDAQKILKNVFTGPERDRVGDVTVMSTGKLIDQLGNESDGVAFSVTLPGSIGRRVNWDNLDQIDLRKVWDVNVDLIK